MPTRVITQLLEITEESKSFKVEVHTSPDDWSSNALRFATREEADAYGSELLSRWMVPDTYRVTGTNDPVNYVFKDGHAQPISP
jgi:hypothetical protein